MTTINIGKYSYINNSINNVNIRHFGDINKSQIIIGKYNSIGKGLTLF